MTIDLYFSQHFGVDPQVLEDYGAFDISVVSDLPLFVDPFLLFDSDNPTYQDLHDDIIKYLQFLRDQATEQELEPHLIDSWYRFKEVKQNWLGFTLFGNTGAGLGRDFAIALYTRLSDIFRDFGDETITRGTHLEKLCLLQPGVGRDNISDFTTNLIRSTSASTRRPSREAISVSTTAMSSPSLASGLTIERDVGAPGHSFSPVCATTSFSSLQQIS